MHRIKNKQERKEKGKKKRVEEISQDEMSNP